MDRRTDGWVGGWIKKSIDGEMIDEVIGGKDGLWMGAWVATSQNVVHIK